MRIVITITRPTTDTNQEEYLLAEDGKPPGFPTVKEALVFLREHNYTMDDAVKLDFNIKRGPGGKNGKEGGGRKYDLLRGEKSF